MRMDKLTGKFQAALGDAQSLAVGRDQQLIEPAHVLLAMLDQQGGTVRPLVLKAGANLTKLRADLLNLVDQLPTVQGTAGDVHVSNDLQRLLNVTDKLAQQRQDQFIASELFVLAAFTKQTCVLAPVATMAVLWLVNPGRTVRVCCFGLILGGGGLAVMSAVTNGGFLRHLVLYNINRFSLRLGGFARAGGAAQFHRAVTEHGDLQAGASELALG